MAYISSSFRQALPNLLALKVNGKDRIVRVNTLRENEEDIWPAMKLREFKRLVSESIRRADRVVKKDNFGALQTGSTLVVVLSAMQTKNICQQVTSVHNK